jgi:D-3-phosphoglycerate dehydrogenase
VGDIFMIGDGYTDYERLQGAVSKFYAFTEGEVDK